VKVASLGAKPDLEANKNDDIADIKKTEDSLL
jgi:hypothetical protein